MAGGDKMKVGDLVRNKSALGVHRNAIGIVIFTRPHLGDVVVYWSSTGQKHKLPMFLLEEVANESR